MRSRLLGRTRLCLLRREEVHFRLLFVKRPALLGSTGREDEHLLLQQQQDVSRAVCIDFVAPHFTGVAEPANM